MTSLCFMHIPKTSGTSVNLYLESQFDRAAICPARSAEDYEAIGREGLLEFKYFRAECGAAVFNLLPGSIPVVTLLRKPLDRAYSHWRYIQRLPEHRLHEQFQREHGTFGAFVATAPANPMARLLAAPSGSPMGSMWSLAAARQRDGEEITDPTAGLSDGDLFELAIARLESFAVVGLAEEHEESIALIAHHFSWAPPRHLPVTNAASITRTVPDIEEEDWSQFVQRNAVDLEVYGAAVRMFRRRQVLYPKAHRKVAYENSLAAQSAPLAHRLVVDLCGPINGTGWLPTIDTDLGPMRPIGAGCEATVDIPVTLGSFTKVEVTCPAVTSLDVLDSLDITVNGATVPFSHKLEPLGITLHVVPPPSSDGERFTTIGFRTSGGVDVPPNHTGAANNLMASLAIRRIELIAYDARAIRFGSTTSKTQTVTGQRAARYFGQRSPAWTFDADLQRRLDEHNLWAHIAELRRDGFTIVRDVIDPKTVERARAVIRRHAKPSGHRTRQSDVMMPLRFDQMFVDLLLNPIQLALADAVCGKGMLDSQAGLVRDRSSNPQGLHAENALWLPAPYPKHHYLCSAMLTLDHFDEADGGTCFVPGSHRSGLDPAPEESLALTGAVTPEAAPGSLIVWVGGTWHGAQQRTNDGERVSLLTIFTRPSLRPAQDLRALPTSLLKNDELRLRLRRDDVYEQDGWYDGVPEQMLHWIRNTPREGDVTFEWHDAADEAALA